MVMKIAIALAGLLAAVCASPAFATTPTAFTAHYQVLKKDKPIGEAVMQLRADGKEWLFTTRTHGEHGLAGLLGITTDESSRFHWRNGHPETQSYDYRLDAGIKKRHRRMRADWSKQRMHVRDDGDDYSYPTVNAMIERHLIPLTLGYEMDSGKQKIALAVAVKKRVDTQHFQLEDRENIQVPIGKLSARRVERSDPGKQFTLWYAPKSYAMPVKLSYGDYTLLMKSYSSP